MYYYKIYKNCVQVAKSHHELTYPQMVKEIDDFAWNNVEIDNDNLRESEDRLGEFIDECWKQAGTEDGLDVGDYILYDTFIPDMYDIPRRNC